MPYHVTFSFGLCMYLDSSDLTQAINASPHIETWTLATGRIKWRKKHLDCLVTCKILIVVDDDGGGAYKVSMTKEKTFH